MKYIFIGEDGSMGYKNGKTYLGDMRVRQFTWFVPFNPFRKKVPYKNQTKFHDNWLEKNGDDRRYESVRLEVLKRYVTLSKSESDAAKQALTSLIKELVEEAKPEKLNDELNYSTYGEGHDTAIDQFEQNLLKGLEEV